jgi:hypothetical protein
MELTTGITLLFKASSVIKGAAGMLGFIESVDQKIDQLVQNDFNTGVRYFNEIAYSKNETIFLLREGANKFRSALNFEEGERKALSYICLAFCQYHLGEIENAKNTLKELENYNYVNVKARNIRKAILGVGITYSIGGAILAMTAIPLISVPTALYVLFKGKTNNSSENIDKIKNMYKKIYTKFNSISSEEKVKILKAHAKEVILEIENN